MSAGAPAHPTIDLVLATLGRTAELQRLLDSLAAQTSRSFRLIVVDQNPDDRLVAALNESGGSLEILHLRSEPGSSRARNVGLRQVVGEIVSFPDDDCWYPADLLERIGLLLAGQPAVDGVVTGTIDEHGQRVGSRAAGPGPLTRYNLWARVGAPRLFLRRDVIERVGPLDETLGVGSATPWQAAADLDYVRRCLEAGFALRYEPGLCVYHRSRRERTPRPDPRQGYSYGLGMGRALAQARLPAWFGAYLCSRPFAASLFSAAVAKPSHARFHLAVGRGRLRGWRSTTR